MEQPKAPLLLDRIFLVLLVVIFAGVVLHAPLSVWLGTVWPDYTLLFKAWKETLLIAATGFAVITAYRARLFKELLRDKLILLIAAYAALHMILLVVFPTDALPAIAGLMIDLRYLLYFVLVYVFLRAFPQYRRLFVFSATVGAVAVLGFALLQVLVLPRDILSYIGYGKDTIMPFLTIDQNPDYVRINSTLRGPNPLGAYAGISLAILLAAFVKSRMPNEKKWWALGGLIAAGGVVALWASYSRSALVATVVAIGIVLLVAVGRRLSRRTWIAGFVVLAALMGGLIIGRDSNFVSHVLLHENPTEGNALNSNDEHFDSLAMGAQRMVAQPLGVGIGTTGSASLYGEKPLIIENQYLFISHESGWLGLLTFLTIYAELLRRLWRQRSDYLALGLFASGIGLALIGLLLPVWVDDTVSLVWWGLAGATLATVPHKNLKKYNSK